MGSLGSENTIEFFGTTTFRLRINGLDLFLDSWLEKTSMHKKYLAIDDVTKADYIFISHAHFDHLPGADRLAIKTGARVVGNPEAIRILRDAGVPEEQLVPVSGGERIPLFDRKTIEATAKGELPGGPPQIPGAPPRPDPSRAIMAVDVWPALHGLVSFGKPHPDVFPLSWRGNDPDEFPFQSTLDISYGMKYFLMRMGKILPPQALEDPGQKAFVEFIEDPNNHYSFCDGGQLMYNFRFGGKAHNEKSILWSSHLGAYEGIMKTLTPKPDIAILGAAGEVNHNGRPSTMSAAEFVVKELEWLGYPERVVWCLHDEAPIAPFSVDTSPAEKLIAEQTKCKIWTLEPAKPYPLF